MYNIIIIAKNMIKINVNNISNIKLTIIRLIIFYHNNTNKIRYNVIFMNYLKIKIEETFSSLKT